MDWVDFVRLAKGAIRRKQYKMREKINDYITLIHIIHTDKPRELVKSCKDILEPNSSNDDACDIKGLKSLKAMKVV